MSRENVDIVRQVIEAFNRADLESCLRHLAPDIDWHDHSEFPGARIHHGHDGVLAHFRAAMEDMADLHADVKAARELGDQVMVRAVISGRGRASGVAVKREAFHVYTLDGRWITRVEIFGSEAEALEAVGLREQAMSRANAEEIIQRATQAWTDRDVDAWVECFHPDAELLLPRNLLEGGSYRGHAGIREAFADAFETWADIDFELDELRVLDDGALALGQTVNVGKGDAPAVEYQSAYLFRLRDGKIVYWRPYQSHREALEAVGLPE